MNFVQFLPLAVGPLVGVGVSVLTDLDNQEAAGLAVGASVVMYGIQSYLDRGRKKKKQQRLKDENQAQLEDEDTNKAAKDANSKGAKRKKKKKVTKANSANSNAEESKRKRKAVDDSAKSSSSDAPVTLSGDAYLAQNPQAQQQQQQQKKNKKKEEEKAASVVPAPEQASAGGKKKKKKKNKNAGAAAASAEAADDEARAIEASLQDHGWIQVSSRRRTKKISEQKDDQPTSTDAVAQPERVSQTFSVPTKQHGKIIGEKGATLQLLEMSTGTKIDIPKRETNTEFVTVSGSDAQSVADCRRAIEQLANLGYSNITHPGTTSSDVSIPSKQHGSVIGKNGQFIKSIQEATGCKVRMPDKEAKNQNRITIIGQKEGIKLAKDAIRALARDGYSSITHPDWIKTELLISRESFATIIGPKGQTIRSVQGDTKTRINIPDKDDENQMVSVVGPQEGVARACAQIMKLLEPPPEPVFEEPAPGDTWGSALPVDDEW